MKNLVRMLFNCKVRRSLSGLCTAVTFLGWISLCHAQLPKLDTDRPAREVLLDGGDQFQIFEDQNQKGRLHLVPKNLHIARDADGTPKVSVILVRDPRSSAASDVNAYGYIWMSVTIGAPTTTALYDRIRRYVESKYPEYRGVILSPISFKPGSAQIGFQVGDSSSKISYIPITAPITVGSEFPVMIPITKEHGEIIRQVMDGDTRELGITIYYKADATFAMAPTVVEVTANKTAIYDYFHEKASSGGGFWIFSWNSERETIREKFEKTGDIRSTTRIGDRELTAQFGGADFLKTLLNDMKARAVDFVADIEVDQSKVVPDGKYEKRSGRITLFSPTFFWSYSTWFGSGSGTVDIQRRSEGRYHESYTLEGQADLPITLVNENVKMPRSVVKVVSLDSAFYVREFISAQGLPQVSAWVTDGSGFQNGRLEVSIGKPSQENQRFVFNFDAASPGAKTSPYWRNATFRQGENGLILPVLPDLYVRANITTKNGIYEAPGGGQYVIVPRGNDVLNPQSVSLIDLFDTFSISAELLFEESQDRGILQVEVRHEGPTPTTEQYTLRRASPFALVPFVKGKKERRSYRVRLVTGRNVGIWGPWRDASDTNEVFLTLSDIPATR